MRPIANEHTDRLLARAARLAVRMQQLNWLVHTAQGHGGSVGNCIHPVCLKTKAILENDTDPTL